jgi:CRP-like cAMP-binding protein
MEWGSAYLFRGLNDRQLERLKAGARKVAVSAGEVICREGEEAAAVYLLSSGTVELVTSINNSIELPVSMLREPGEMFGSSALIEPHIYSLTAKCASAGTVVMLERNALEEYMAEDHEAGLAIMRNLAGSFLSRLKESRQELKIHFNTLLRSFRT